MPHSRYHDPRGPLRRDPHGRRAVGAPGGGFGGRDHAGPGRRLLDGTRRRAIERGAPASRLRPRLLDRAPQGHERRVRPVPQRHRPQTAGQRAPLRRGRRGRAYSPSPGPVGRRSGIRPPPRGGSLVVRGARLLRLEGPPPAHRSRVGKGRARRRPTALSLGPRRAGASPRGLRSRLQRDRADREPARRREPLQGRGYARQPARVDAHRPPPLSLWDRRRPGAVHRRERARGGPGSEPRRPGRLARPDAAALLRPSRRGRRPPFRRLSLRHVGRSRRGGRRRTIAVSPRFDNLMMSYPLTLTHFFERSRRLFARKAIATRVPGKPLFRYTYGDFAERTMRLAGALAALGVRRGDRVATFAWNSHRHLELYWATPLSGAVLHTLNIRLSPLDLTYIVNHAGDSVIFADASLWPVLAAIRDKLPTVRQIVIMPDGVADAAETAGREHRAYEALLAAAQPVSGWPELRETDAAGVCYLRHHRPPERRGLHASGDGPYLPRRSHDGPLRHLGGRTQPA